MPTKDIAKRRAATRLRVQRYRLRHAGQATAKRVPFIGIDGEGGGKDSLGRQRYLLMHAAGGSWNRELFRDNRQLTTAECLDFILDLPDTRRAILVGYFFGYDVTQILRDLPEERLRHLLDRDKPKEQRYTYWGRFALEYVPKQYLRVARVKDNGHGKGTIAGSSRTVNEVGGFFQKSFVEACKSWEVGDEATMERIVAGKEARAGFEAMNDELRAYCAAECKLLSQLMAKLRQACRDADCMPTSWRGAGSIAAGLYKRHNMPTKRDMPPVEEGLHNASVRGYFGGRFETPWLGRVDDEPIWEHDISSAYPAYMRLLPCVRHTRWHRFEGQPNPFELMTIGTGHYIADIAFQQPPGTPLGAFPVRTKSHVLLWPLAARGWYWSPEIITALDRVPGIEITWFGGYWAEKCCDCEPYHWIEPLYEARRQLGKQTRGFPIKLGINALYGKKAQRFGGAPYHNMIEAGLITSYTRAAVFGAATDAPHDVVMIATDAVYSRRRLAVPEGGRLGQWEVTEKPKGLFIVQPGIYWQPDSDALPKTRGIPRSRIIAQRDTFERAWDRWCNGDGDGSSAPFVEVKLQTFIGHRLALHRNKLELAGRWDYVGRKISFDWGKKRRRLGADVRSGMVTTSPHVGQPNGMSWPYDPKLLTEVELNALLYEAQPDWEPIGNSGE